MTNKTLQWLVPLAAGLLLAGCGDDVGGAAAPTEDQRARAQAAGFDVELVYVADVDGYEAVAGGSGVYGTDGYQQIYASDQGDDIRLTVERRPLDNSSCVALPIPAVEAPVRCTRDGDGWMRDAGDRHEYAVSRGDVLVRVSGASSATGSDLIRSAALEAEPAPADDLEDILPPMPEGPVERGDITGDNAPDNGVGAGG